MPLQVNVNVHIPDVNSNRPACRCPRARGRTRLAGLLRSAASSEGSFGARRQEGSAQDRDLRRSARLPGLQRRLADRPRVARLACRAGPARVPPSKREGRTCLRSGFRHTHRASRPANIQSLDVLQDEGEQRRSGLGPDVALNVPPAACMGRPAVDWNVDSPEGLMGSVTICSWPTDTRHRRERPAAVSCLPSPLPLGSVGPG